MAVRPRTVSASPEQSSVLTKAVTRAAGLLGLTQRQVAGTLGLSGPTASRLFTGKYRLSRSRSKEWELAVLFVRLFRSLDALWGHDDVARTWLASPNLALGTRPRDLLTSVEGLVPVVAYLDAARGVHRSTRAASPCREHAMNPMSCAAPDTGHRVHCHKEEDALSHVVSLARVSGR